MPCGAATVFMNLTDLESAAHDKIAMCPAGDEIAGDNAGMCISPNNKEARAPSRSGEPIGAPAHGGDRDHAATRCAAMI
jgi:hypothetical protein